MVSTKKLRAMIAPAIVATCVVACAQGSTADDYDPLVSYEIQMNDPAEKAEYDRAERSSERPGEAAIASFEDGDAKASCWVTLDWCDTPWISPHPVATCHSTGCGCAYAKQVCASLVSQHCGAVRGYGNDCR